MSTLITFCLLKVHFIWEFFTELVKCQFYLPNFVLVNVVFFHNVPNFCLFYDFFLNNLEPEIKTKRKISLLYFSSHLLALTSFICSRTTQLQFIHLSMLECRATSYAHTLCTHQKVKTPLGLSHVFNLSLHTLPSTENHPHESPQKVWKEKRKSSNKLESRRGKK